ncbi:MAG: histidine kinase [Mobilicoccus sp.]|nr:histidine kinase [Mobilicoccus sp.]
MQHESRPAGPPGPQWPLFAAQLGVGAAGLVALALAMVFSPNAPWLAILLFLAVVGGTLAALAVIERRKWPAAAPAPVDYAQDLRDLRTSRRAIVGAYEIERRRIERDLHDGAQQYLVASSMKLGEAGLMLDRLRDDVDVAAPQRAVIEQVAQLLDAAHDDADGALTALRTTVAGIHPRLLTDLGLEAAVRDVAERIDPDVTVRVPHPLPTLPEGVVATAYFFVSEALTNVAKHAPQASATVVLAADRSLHVSVVDDGPGGAEIAPGRGLSGMRERLAAFGGTMELASPTGGPTSVTARIPVLLDEGMSAVMPEVEG